MVNFNSLKKRKRKSNFTKKLILFICFIIIPLYGLLKFNANVNFIEKWIDNKNSNYNYDSNLLEDLFGYLYNKQEYLMIIGILIILFLFLNENNKQLEKEHMCRFFNNSGLEVIHEENENDMEN